MRSVLDRVVIADVLRLAGVAVEQRGQRTWFSCPVHRPDRHPSAVIVSESGWTCHVCRAHGGIFDLVVALGLAADRPCAARFLDLAL
jgi:hypothetical protein